MQYDFFSKRRNKKIVCNYEIVNFFDPLFIKTFSFGKDVANPFFNSVERASEKKESQSFSLNVEESVVVFSGHRCSINRNELRSASRSIIKALATIRKAGSEE